MMSGGSSLIFSGGGDGALGLVFGDAGTSDVFLDFLGESFLAKRELKNPFFSFFSGVPCTSFCS